MDEVMELAESKNGFIKTMWCGDVACERSHEGGGRPVQPLHALRAGASVPTSAPCCGKPAQKMVVWGVAY